MENIDKNLLSIKELTKHMTEEVAPKYFENTMDVNMLRTGIFGVLNETISNVTQSLAYKTSEMTNEMILKNAKYNSTIFENASFLRFSDYLAKPAKATFGFAIPIVPFIKNAVLYEDQYVSYISRYTHIEVGDFLFNIPYDIRLSFKPINGPFIDITNINQYDIEGSVKATFMKDGTFYEDLEVTHLDSGLSSIESNSNTGRYLFFIVNGLQLERVTKYHPITNDNDIDTHSFELKFDGDLAGLKVEYREPKENKFKPIKELIVNSPPIRDNFCYYQYVKTDSIMDENILEISFSDKLGYFKPKLASEFRITIFTTEGDRGNIKYDGECIVKKNDVEVIDGEFKDLMLVELLDDSIGGKDAKSINEIKDIIIHKNMTANTIITDNDMNEYFRINHGDKIKFYKQRDDIRRVFNAYLKLKHTNGLIYSTNTLNTIINEDEFDIVLSDTRKIINIGKRFVYKHGSNGELYDSTLVVKNDDADYKFEYVTPFMLVVDKTDTKCMTLINHFNYDLRLRTDFVNPKSLNIPVISDINVTRNVIKDKDQKYTLTIRCMDLSFMDNLEYRVILPLKDEEETYIEFSRMGNDLVATLTTDDMIDDNGKLRITSGVNVKDGKDVVTTIKYDNIDVDIFIYVKEDNIEGQYKSDYSDFTYLNLKNDGYILTSRFTASKSLSFLKDITQFVKIDMEYIKESVDAINYQIKLNHVPMIRSTYIDEYLLYDDKGDTLNVIYDSIDEAIESVNSIGLVTNNQDIHIKFFNTYGVSKQFILNKNTILDKNCLSMKFTIGVFDKNIIMDIVEYKNDIRNFIIRYVESLNDGVDNNIYVSNLYRAIEDNFKNIKYVVLKKLNSYEGSTESIELKDIDRSKMSYEEFKNFTPEFISVDTIYKPDLNKYIADVEIELV